MARRIAFRPVEHAATNGHPALVESLVLEHPEPGWFELTRTLRPADGAEAKLVTEGASADELFARAAAVPLERHFVMTAGCTLARSYRAHGDTRLQLTAARARVDHLDIALRVPRVSGIPAEIEITSAAGEAIDLPDDLLAVLGWPWTRIARKRDAWLGQLRLRGDGVERTPRRRSEDRPHPRAPRGDAGRAAAALSRTPARRALGRHRAARRAAARVLRHDRRHRGHRLARARRELGVAHADVPRAAAASAALLRAARDAAASRCRHCRAGRSRPRGARPPPDHADQSAQSPAGLHRRGQGRADRTVRRSAAAPARVDAVGHARRRQVVHRAAGGRRTSACRWWTCASPPSSRWTSAARSTPTTRRARPCGSRRSSCRRRTSPPASCSWTNSPPPTSACRSRRTR